MNRFRPGLRRWAFMSAAAAVLIAGCAGSNRGPSDDSGIRTAVARHLITEAVPARLGSEVPPYCLGIGSLTTDSAPADPDGKIISALRAEGLEVQPVTTCDLPDGAPGRVTDRSTGEQRVLLLVSRGEPAGPGNRSVEAQYYRGGTSAAGWRCDVEDRAGGWNVGRCDLIWES